MTWLGCKDNGWGDTFSEESLDTSPQPPLMNSWESKGAVLRVTRNDPEGGVVRQGHLMYNHSPQHYALHEARPGSLVLAAWFGTSTIHSTDWSDDVGASLLENDFLERVLVPSLTKAPVRYLTKKQKVALERAGYYIPDLVVV
jgi:hypothetical protein